MSKFFLALTLTSLLVQNWLSPDLLASAAIVIVSVALGVVTVVDALGDNNKDE